jgi:hypothetical protein
MSSKNLLDRTTQLANGAEVPLSKAAMYYSILIGHAACGESDLLNAVRQASLGKTLTAEQQSLLNDEKFLEAGGTNIEPVLKQVALAAIRGEDGSLHLDSPFVNHLDRSIFEYQHSREVIRTQVDDEVAVEQFLQADSVQKRVSSWTKRAGGEKLPGGLPDM